MVRAKEQSARITSKVVWYSRFIVVLSLIHIFSNQIEGELKQFEESLYGTEYTTSATSDSALQKDRNEEEDSQLDTARARRSQELREGKSNQRKVTKATKSKKKSRADKKRAKKATQKAAKTEHPKQSKSSSTRSVRNRF